MMMMMEMSAKSITAAASSFVSQQPDRTVVISRATWQTDRDTSARYMCIADIIIVSDSAAALDSYLVSREVRYISDDK